MFNFGATAQLLRPKTAKVVRGHIMPLTPERIPSFIIPPKLQIRSPRARHEDTDRTRLLSPDHRATLRRGDLSPSFVLSSRSPRFPKLSPVAGGSAGHVAAGRVSEDRTDLSTRAALGLEHVKKISTPYGFRTLAESPHVRRRESLFHGDRYSTCKVADPPSVSPCAVSAVNEQQDTGTRLPTCNGEMVSPFKALKSERSPRQSPNPTGVAKSSKDKLQLFLRNPRYGLKTLTPRRAAKGPSSTCS